MQLAAAAQNIDKNPIALELRRLQMLTEIGAENNATTIIMMPSDFMNLAKTLTDKIKSNQTIELPKN